MNSIESQLCPRLPCSVLERHLPVNGCDYDYSIKPSARLSEQQDTPDCRLEGSRPNSTHNRRLQLSVAVLQGRNSSSLSKRSTGPPDPSIHDALWATSFPTPYTASLILPPHFLPNASVACDRGNSLNSPWSFMNYLRLCS
jgi:hypothetical protein